MLSFRKYGKPPYRIAVIHGGPGAAGEMAPVARKLSEKYGVLEPLQTKDTINGQVEELKEVIKKNSESPVTLIGWSWGAWLSLIFAAKYPDLVRKLILVSSGPFEEKYVNDIMKTRINRLSSKEKKEQENLQKTLNDPKIKEKDKSFARFGELFSKTDSFEPLPTEAEEITINHNIYNKVWNEASELRSSGKLLEMARLVRCPVVAIHGDYDPHPAAGVKLLSEHIRDFKFILLKNCGHTPWKERLARDKFFQTLEVEIKP